jgi:predicted RNA-binding Zn-ribbon protein involved in translation (DUF1610 family)
MTECYLNYSLPDAAPVNCPNCEWVGKSIDLEMVRDIQERIYPGETVPAGQCPECGALAMLTEQEKGL